MPDRYGENDDPVLDFDSHRRARQNAAAREAAQRQRQRLDETRAVHAPMTNDQAAIARQHQRTVTEQAEKRRNALRTANCALCDDDGYTPNLTICDHREHYESTAHGRAECREVLAQIAAKKGTTR